IPTTGRGQRILDDGVDAFVRAVDHRSADSEVLARSSAYRRLAAQPRRRAGRVSHRSIALLGASMLGNLGPMELIIILVIVLVIFGAKRVPEIGASIGKGIREFKRNLSDVDRQIKEPERDARSDRLNAGDPVRREDDATSEPKRLIS